jgi:hypothetical protein
VAAKVVSLLVLLSFFDLRIDRNLDEPELLSKINGSHNRCDLIVKVQELNNRLINLALDATEVVHEAADKHASFLQLLPLV